VKRLWWSRARPRQPASPAPSLARSLEWGRTRLLTIPVLAYLFLAPAGTTRAAALEHPDGRQLYLNHCAGCHGPSGRGNGTQLANSLRKPHSFADCSWMNLMSDATLYLVISEGSSAGGFRAGMPAFGAKLSYAQMASLIEYVRSFCRPRPAAADQGAQASASWNAVSAR